MRVLWVGLLAVPAVADSLVRLVLQAASNAWKAASGAEVTPPRSWLVVVPAREEGEAAESTLASAALAARAHAARVVLVLDGPDPVAEAIARRHGVEVAVKTPSGPSKGAVLAWVAEHLRADLDAVDGVLFLDVGSTVPEDFFDRFTWPQGADGVQAFLAARGDGTAAGVALSERAAQAREDCGRQALGWSVRLRGTGMGLTPKAFLSVASRLRTNIEDLEASLLLTAAGARLVMAPREAAVADEKPATVGAAARQRSRWLAGRLLMFARQPGAIVRLLARRPLEGLAFILDLLGRPLSLTVLLRLAVIAVLGVGAARAWPAPAEAVAALIIAGSIVSDALLVGAGRRGSWRGAAQLVCAWIAALWLLPSAFVGWVRTRRP